MDNSVDQNQIIAFIMSLVKSILNIISQGPVGAGIALAVVLFGGIFIWIFKAKITNWFRMMAARITQDEANRAKEEAEQRAKESEKELDELAAKMKLLVQSEKKSMLDALSFEELKSFAVQAHGPEAVDAILSKSKSELESRYEIYLLYGFKPAS